MAEVEKKHLSWEEFHEMTRELAGRVEDSGFRPDYLIGITRGGLPPAAIVGEVLGMKDVTTISARSYDGVDQGELSVTCLPQVDLRGKKVLLIDEITDTGETLVKIANLVAEKYGAEVKTAVVVVNIDHCKQMPDYFVSKTQVWVVFPWQEWPRRKREEWQ